MLSLYDMMARAQNGHALELMARQYNLSQQQMQLAMEAVLPAFSQGLKRNASDPWGVSSFLQVLANGQHARFYDDPSRAFSPDGISEGNSILNQLFGSKELSRAIAAQAAQVTGIQQDIFKQMLPALATMIMGGLYRQSTQPGQAQPGSFGFGGNVLGDIIEQMMRQGGQGQPQGRQAPQPNPMDPFDNPFGKVLKDMFGGGPAGSASPRPDARQAPQSGPLDNPLGRIFEEMLGGGRARQPEPAPKPSARSPEPESDRKEAGRSPYDDLFGEMFETGRKHREDYQKSMDSIFDQYLKGMNRQR